METKTKCVECGGINLEVLDGREGVDGFAAYKFRCQDCDEEFGVRYDNCEIVDYFFD